MIHLNYRGRTLCDYIPSLEDHTSYMIFVCIRRRCNHEQLKNLLWSLISSNRIVKFMLKEEIYWRTIDRLFMFYTWRRTEEFLFWHCMVPEQELYNCASHPAAIKPWRVSRILVVSNGPRTLWSANLLTGFSVKYSHNSDRKKITTTTTTTTTTGKYQQYITLLHAFEYLVRACTYSYILRTQWRELGISFI